MAERIRSIRLTDEELEILHGALRDYADQPWLPEGKRKREVKALRDRFRNELQKHIWTID